MSAYEILTLLIAAATATTLIVQVGLTLKTLKADHERRKKQATFEFIQKIRSTWIDAKYAIEEKWGNNPLTEKDLIEIEKNFDLEKLVTTLLAQLEHLSVGMNSGVFDKDLLYRMSGSQLIGIYNRLRSYIEKAQKGLPTAYIEYQDLVKSFEERKRIKPISEGNIENS